MGTCYLRGALDLDFWNPGSELGRWGTGEPPCAWQQNQSLYMFGHGSRRGVRTWSKVGEYYSKVALFARFRACDPFRAGSIPAH